MSYYIYDQRDYTEKRLIGNRKIEEASVNFLAQELSQVEHIEVIASVYNDMCDVLRNINSEAKLFDSDFAFALELFNKPLNERIDWIRNLVYANTEDIEQITRIAWMLDTLE